MGTEKRDIKSAYLAGDPVLQNFASWNWPHADWKAIFAARSQYASPREALVAELQQQNTHLPENGLVLENIAALSSERTFTITTGHQVCLMGGPMFTLYKIASAIAMAQDLGWQHPEYRFVPVLWMATEDHDWEEVNHFFPSFGDKRTYESDFSGPVGRHVLTEAILKTIPEEISAEIRNFYRPGQTMGNAFRHLMHHLFGQFGLVILDADRPSLKKEFSAIIQAELTGAGIGTAVRDRSAELEELGFKAQIYPRDINLFYLGGGQRILIDRHETGYQLKDGSKTWTSAEILAELEAHPENFSPNVALRPIYQELLLPNLAYIGGWAEVSYWLQLKAGFDQVGVFYPMVVPRLHATLVLADQAAEWEALALPLSALAQPLHLLNDEYLALHWQPEALEADILAVNAAFDKLALHVESIDPTQATGIRAEQAKSNNAFDNLRKKIKKSIRNRNPLPYQTIARLKNAIEPENSPQQRTLNFSAFASIDPQFLAKILVQNALWKQSTNRWIVLP